MCVSKVLLTKKQYQDLQKLQEKDKTREPGTYSYVCKYMQDNVLSDDICAGYGFYGVRKLFEERPHPKKCLYYAEILIGNSCD